MNLPDKVLDNVKEDDNGCWNWQKSCRTAGYGQIFINGKNAPVHKFVYEFIHGKLPEGIVVRHKCHNRKCCNPDHLLAGTHTDNYHDSIDVHKAASKKKRNNWSINGVSYPTVRIARAITGIGQGTISKHTKNGIFDIKSYYKACEIARTRPATIPSLKDLTDAQKALIEENS